MFSKRLLRIKAMQYLYGFFLQEEAFGNEARQAREQWVNTGLHQEVEKIKAAHAQFLQLFLVWQAVDTEAAEGEFPKRLVNLGQHKLLHELRVHPLFLKLCRRYPVRWQEDIIQLAYYETVKKKLLSKLAQHPEAQAVSDIELLQLLIKAAFNNAALQAEIGKTDLLWSDNQLVVKKLLINFFTEFAQDPSGNKAFALYTLPELKNEQGFYSTLVGETMAHSLAYETEITATVRHWEPERILPLDKLLIKMLLTEIRYCEPVPTRVAVNEYLEIAKAYSSQQSARFIHGVADAIIQKTGVGNA